MSTLIQPPVKSDILSIEDAAGLVLREAQSAVAAIKAIRERKAAKATAWFKASLGDYGPGRGDHWQYARDPDYAITVGEVSIQYGWDFTFPSLLSGDACHVMPSTWVDEPYIFFPPEASFTQSHVGCLIQLSDGPNVGNWVITKIEDHGSWGFKVFVGGKLADDQDSQDLPLDRPWVLLLPSHLPAQVIAQTLSQFLAGQFTVRADPADKTQYYLDAVREGEAANTVTLTIGKKLKAAHVFQFSGTNPKGGTKAGLDSKTKKAMEHADKFFKNVDGIMALGGLDHKDLVDKIGILPHTLKGRELDAALTANGVPTLNGNLMVMDHANPPLAGLTDLIRLVGVQKTRELVAEGRSVIIVSTRMDSTTTVSRCGDTITTISEKVVGINVPPRSVNATKVYVFQLRRPDHDELIDMGLTEEEAAATASGDNTTIPNPGGLNASDDDLQAAADMNTPGAVLNPTDQQKAATAAAAVDTLVSSALPPNNKDAMLKLFETSPNLIKSLTNDLKSCSEQIAALMDLMPSELKAIFRVVNGIFDTIGMVADQVKTGVMTIINTVTSLVKTAKNFIDTLIPSNVKNAIGLAQCILGLNIDIKLPSINPLANGIIDSIDGFIKQVQDAIADIMEIISLAAKPFKMLRMIIGGIINKALGEIPCVQPLLADIKPPAWLEDWIQCIEAKLETLEGLINTPLNAISSVLSSLADLRKTASSVAGELTLDVFSAVGLNVNVSPSETPSADVVATTTLFKSLGAAKDKLMESFALSNIAPMIGG